MLENVATPVVDSEPPRVVAPVPTVKVLPPPTLVVPLKVLDPVTDRVLLRVAAPVTPSVPPSDVAPVPTVKVLAPVTEVLPAKVLAPVTVKPLPTVMLPLKLASPPWTFRAKAPGVAVLMPTLLPLWNKTELVMLLAELKTGNPKEVAAKAKTAAQNDTIASGEQRFWRASC